MVGWCLCRPWLGWLGGVCAAASGVGGGDSGVCVGRGG